MKKLIIDRFEGNYAVCEWEDRGSKVGDSEWRVKSKQDPA